MTLHLEENYSQMNLKLIPGGEALIVTLINKVIIYFLL